MAPHDAGSIERSRTGAGERLVLVHGFTQTGGSWRHLIGPLAETYEVLTVDLPGHGSSATVRARDLEETAALLGETGGRATYVGYSLGGRVCLTLALEQPELIERLVLVGATAGIVDAAERSARRRADEALATRLAPDDGTSGQGLEAFIADWLAGPLFAHLDARQADVASRLENRPEGLAESLRRVGAGTQRPSHELLGRLEMPVLVVAGEHDTKFCAIAHDLANAIGANARVAIVAGSGHAVPFEQPAAFTALLSEFCAS